MAAARLAGLVERGERIRLAFSPGKGGGGMVGRRAPLPAGSGRYTFRAAEDAAEVTALVARIAQPEVLTGKEVAKLRARVVFDPLQPVN
jgi:hypothetical protein